MKLFNKTSQILFLLLLFVAAGCNTEKKVTHLQGETMGTYYNIKYIGETEKNVQHQIDSLLKVINMSMSTYIDSSIISRFNQDTIPVKVDEHFRAVFERAKKVYKTTNGAFDPTVMPLVNGWGFGFENARDMDSSRVDSLQQLVDFNSVTLQNDSVRKDRAQIMLDFSAIAKGYGVDVVAALLEEKGLKDFAVEIGGEVVVKGSNSKGKDWLFAIAKPEDDPGANYEIYKKISLKNEALATSGNYKNYYIENGQKYSHTIDPTTGYPVQHNLLSASVLAGDCTIADAFATAFMVMGTKKAIELSKKIEEVSVFLIYEDNGRLKTYTTPGIEKKFTE